MSQFINILSKINDLIILELFQLVKNQLRRATSKDIFKNLIKINQNVIYLKTYKIFK